MAQTIRSPDRMGEKSMSFIDQGRRVMGVIKLSSRGLNPKSLRDPHFLSLTLGVTLSSLVGLHRFEPVL
jgi:hypothetical protein